VTYLPLPDYLETEPRYTTIQDVKQAMGIDAPTLDDVIKQSIVAIELLIDVHLGTSYPQDPDPNAGTDDALNPPPIEGIPVSIKKAAKLGAMKLVKLDDTATGEFGSVDFIGEFSFEDSAGRAFTSVMPLLTGLRREFPLG